ncbi:MAG: TfoX/Sxy family protein [Candidatus Omnitrophota bacterium]|nr:TfoX/Sxy family protein [Candidatus Omnitrophota bacterium]MDZ4241487.1 TfoX/Sxy family protein [Candidatus Omnitrophota bacterium]
MPDHSFRDFVLDQLSGLDVDCRRMFGGEGLYLRGRFFGIIFKEALYFKTDEKSRPDYVKMGSSAFKPNARQTLKTYYEVPVDVIEDRPRLLEWAGKAAAVAKQP